MDGMISSCFKCNPKISLLNFLFNRTPLHLAVAGDNISVVEHLLSEDAKLQILDRESKSPLIIVRDIY